MARLKQTGLVREAVPATREQLGRTADYALNGLVDEGWGRRYGRPVRLGKNPTRPKTRINTTGADARHLLEHLSRNHPGLLGGPQVQALRRILVQNYSGTLRAACAGATMTTAA